MSAALQLIVAAIKETLPTPEGLKALLIQLQQNEELLIH